jgi:hypothetical protein
MTSSPASLTSSATPRWATPATPGRKSFAGKTAAVAEALGFGGLMPWQRETIGTATEIREDGLPAYREVVVEVPRQQGKNISILSLMIARALAADSTMISYSA